MFGYILILTSLLSFCNVVSQFHWVNVPDLYDFHSVLVELFNSLKKQHKSLKHSSNGVTLPSERLVVESKERQWQLRRVEEEESVLIERNDGATVAGGRPKGGKDNPTNQQKMSLGGYQP